MTPMLILLFSVKPSAAISSDLVAAVVMRPVGAAVHFQKGTVNLRLVGWLAAGSVPAAFIGSYILHEMGHAKAATHNVELLLGGALLLGSAAMVGRYLIDRHTGNTRAGLVTDIQIRPLATLAVGALGGLVVGMTSVGAGSLMIVLLMFAYPILGANQLVGTDLAQAIPLTASAAIGAAMFGQVDLPLTTSIIVGSVPAVLVGSMLSSRIDDRYLRPAILTVILASGLKYVGVATTPLAWAVGVFMVAILVNWVLRGAPWQRSRSRAVGGSAGAGPDAVLATAAAEPGLSPQRELLVASLAPDSP